MLHETGHENVCVLGEQERLRLIQLLEKAGAWASKTFGDKERFDAIAAHLDEEVDELFQEIHVDGTPNRQEMAHEFADCFMLIGHLLRHNGLSPSLWVPAAYRHVSLEKAEKTIRDTLPYLTEVGALLLLMETFLSLAKTMAVDPVESVSEKLSINLRRRWLAPDDNGVIRHYKEEETPMTAKAPSTSTNRWRGRVPAQKPSSASDRDWAIFLAHVNEEVPMLVLGRNLNLSRERVRQIVDTVSEKLETRTFSGLPLAVARILAREFGTPSNVRQASDETLLYTVGIGEKRLQLIRSLQDTWE